MKRTLLLFFLSLVLMSDGKPAVILPQTQISLSPQARISLLTCSAGTEIYSYFGHSAIRVNDPTTNLDSVFNYGVFSFETPNFIWRFCKGETDYMLAVQSMNSFLSTYYEERRDVYEQALNFTAEERQSLFDALMENAKPENRVYRYNHFLDNCATLIRDQFEIASKGQLQYDTLSDQSKSFRNLLDECLPDNSWSGFGIKLALGVPADRKTTFSQKMFLPPYLQSNMANAVIVREEGKVPFSQPIENLYKAPEAKGGFSLTSPAVAVWLFFLITLGFSIREYRIKKRFIWLDFVIYLSFGIAGLILGFLSFISELESTGWNLNLIWAWPTHFVFAFLLLIPSLRDKLSWYTRLATYILLFFLVSLYFLPQTFHWLVIPLCLTLLLRTVEISEIRRIVEKRKAEAAMALN